MNIVRGMSVLVFLIFLIKSPDGRVPLFAYGFRGIRTTREQRANTARATREHRTDTPHGDRMNDEHRTDIVYGV